MGALSNIDWRDFVRVLKQLGYVEARQRGDHHCFVKADCVRPIVVPEQSPLAEFVVKANMKTAGLSREDLLRMLGNQ